MAVRGKRLHLLDLDLNAAAAQEVWSTVKHSSQDEGHRSGEVGASGWVRTTVCLQSDDVKSLVAVLPGAPAVAVLSGL